MVATFTVRGRVSNPAALIITSATLGQALLSLSLIGARAGRRGAEAPLAIVLSAAAVVQAAGALTAVQTLDRGLLFALSLPAWLSLAPGLALYVEALTAETEWRLKPIHARRFKLAALSLIALPMILALSPADRRTMMEAGQSVAGIYPLVVGLFLFALILAGTTSAGVHAVHGLRRLARYRRRLKALFANNDRCELRWLSALVAILAGIWLLAVVSLAVDTLHGAALLPDLGARVLGLVAIWTLALLGLGQMPGFEGRWVEPEFTEVPELSPPSKYRKSALTVEQAQRVVARLETAMREERLYLDPTLSLPKLAAHLKVSSNLLSQVLNERLGQSFFAYVNRWRVEAAAAMVSAGDRTVLEIALEVGFNSKSAFYAAFKAVFGVSPAKYAD